MSEKMYIFVIDTDSYSGNFEREMCAYITGQVGDCGVGEEQQEIFLDEEPEELSDSFDEKIATVPDDHGCCRPCYAGATPGYGNDGRGNFKKIQSGEDAKKYPYPAGQSVAIYFDEKPTAEMCATMIRRAKKFATQPISEQENKITILNFRFIERVTTIIETEVPLPI